MSQLGYLPMILERIPEVEVEITVDGTKEEVAKM